MYFLFAEFNYFSTKKKRIMFHVYEVYGKIEDIE